MQGLYLAISCESLLKQSSTSLPISSDVIIFPRDSFICEKCRSLLSGSPSGLLRVELFFPFFAFRTLMEFISEHFFGISSRLLRIRDQGKHFIFFVQTHSIHLSDGIFIKCFHSPDCSTEAKQHCCSFSILSLFLIYY